MPESGSMKRNTFYDLVGIVSTPQEGSENRSFSVALLHHTAQRGLSDIGSKPEEVDV
jgi:hypothetical protein